jgi:DivIVA domain-containing protein
MSEHSARPASQPTATRSTDEIVQHAFPTVRKGLDEGQVRGFLRRLAGDLEAAQRREAELRQRVADLEQRSAAAPELTPEILLQALGEETARVLRSAQEAAEDIRRRAEEHAAALVSDAHEEARTVREETRTIVEDRTAEAQAAADAIREDAEARGRTVRAEADAYAAATREEADRDASSRTAAAHAAAAETTAEAESQARQVRSDADAYAATTKRTADETAAERLADATRRATAEVDGARTRGREMVAEAQAVRERMLGDLSRRKAAAHARLEELRAGRDRLLEAYSVVRRTLEETTNALGHADDASADRRAPAASTAPAGETVVGGIVFDVEVPRPLATLVPSDEGADDDEALDVAAPTDVTAAHDDDAEDLSTDGPAPATEDDGVAAAVASDAADDAAEDDASDGDADELAADDDPSDEPASDEPASGDRVVVLESGDPIDALFERLRTSRTPAPAGAPSNGTNGGHTANGHGSNGQAPHAEPAPAATGVAVLDLPSQERRDDDREPAHVEVELDVRGGDLALVTRRDEQVRPLVAGLARKVKRALQDEQNELLSALRRSRKAIDLAVLPALDDRMAALAGTARPLLTEAYVAGAAGADVDPADAVAGIADDLARELLAPLRERLVATLAPGGVPAADAAEAAERVSAQYREWKTQRVEGAVHDALHTAWVRGGYDATPAGTTLRWVLDPLGTCPDCEDDALEPTAKGESFPTGHVHPPAHPGCRCMVAPG